MAYPRIKITSKHSTIFRNGFSYQTHCLYLSNVIVIKFESPCRFVKFVSIFQLFFHNTSALWIPPCHQNMVSKISYCTKVVSYFCTRISNFVLLQNRTTYMVMFNYFLSHWKTNCVQRSSFVSTVHPAQRIAQK